MKQEKEMKRVLWISRHTMTQTQLADLQRVMGGPIQLTMWPETVEDVEALRPMVEQSDAVAAVLPMEKLAQLLKITGNRPVLQAKSGRMPTGHWAIQPTGAVEQEFAFVHLGWQQILEVQVKTRAL